MPKVFNRKDIANHRAQTKVDRTTSLPTCVHGNRGLVQTSHMTDGLLSFSVTPFCSASLSLGSIAEASASTELVPMLPSDLPVQRQTTAAAGIYKKGKTMISSRPAMKPQLAQSAGSAVKAYKTICKHGRRKTLCKPCQGGSICVHGKQRGWCKQCGGTALCSHGRQKSRCAECGGKGLCIHEKVRRVCSLCTPCYGKGPG